ncbi:hypothetical protein NQ318_008912 [Aromia moschata]|uniref:Protein-tyrosine-phosphatase n=1 Tax=Aromia moschata TaxID=1265417 RepID=A0AAV8ZAV9_9CUCU|nr:hypothetical protein NQ318_008912 [Aromia moschata]
MVTIYTYKIVADELLAGFLLGTLIGGFPSDGGFTLWSMGLNIDMDILHRIDFTLGPISIDQIEDNLYLGGLAAAKDISTLSKYKITHIVTIDTCPLPRNILQLKHITTKYIQLSDLPKEDLLTHFDDAETFIKEGLSKGAVLVHCYFGVSRSATIVIAYIMKKYQIPYQEAFERVKAKRSIVFPNQGFVSQLKLYREMGYTVDPKNMHFKAFRLNVAADRHKAHFVKA